MGCSIEIDQVTDQVAVQGVRNVRRDARDPMRQKLREGRRIVDAHADWRQALGCVFVRVEASWWRHGSY